MKRFKRFRGARTGGWLRPSYGAGTRLSESSWCGGVMGAARRSLSRNLHSQRWRAGSVGRCVCRLWGCLRLAVEWRSRNIEFEDVRGFALDPLLNGEEPAECGNLRAFGGELMGVDIGELETQKPRLSN